eukprot:Opistho-1_new@30376
MSITRILVLLSAAAAIVAGPMPASARQTAAEPPPEGAANQSGGSRDEGPLDLADLLGGGRLKGARLEVAIQKASGYPLGSKENPVRVSMPRGQQAYLRRLRCSNDKAPQYEHVGSFGPGVFGSIIDGYRVICAAGAQPGESMIFMDMYHPEHVETAAPPGFTLKSRAVQP